MRVQVEVFSMRHLTSGNGPKDICKSLGLICLVECRLKFCKRIFAYLAPDSRGYVYGLIALSAGLGLRRRP